MSRPPTESQSCMGVLMALMWQLFKGSCLTLCFQAYQVSWSNIDPQTRSRIKEEEEFSLHRSRHVKQSGKSPLGIPHCQWLETHHTSGSILYKRRHDEHYIPDRGSCIRCSFLKQEILFTGAFPRTDVRQCNKVIVWIRLQERLT